MKNTINRRDILKAIGLGGAYAGGVAANSLPLISFAESCPVIPENNSALVVIFQRGACDGMNVVAPNRKTAEEFYYYNQMRPIAGLKEWEVDKYKIGNSGYSVHPVLMGDVVGNPYFGQYESDTALVTSGLSQAISDGNLTFFPGTHVGISSTSNPIVGSMSHFAAQDILDSGGGGGSIKNVYDNLSGEKKGWVARTVNIPSDYGDGIKVYGFNSDKSLSGLSQRGYFISQDPTQAGSWVYGGIEGFHKNNLNQVRIRNQGASANQEAENWREIQEILFSTSVDIANLDYAAAQKDYRFVNIKGENPYITPMGKLLSDTEVILKNYPELQFVTINQPQYDTHAAQRPRLDNLLKDLGDNLGVFYERMKTCGRPVNVVVVTEFGRTFRETGSGTDHGQGFTAISMTAGSQNIQQHRLPIHFGPAYDGIAPQLKGEFILPNGAQFYVKPTQDYRNIVSEILQKRMQGIEVNNPFIAADPNYEINFSNYLI